MNNIKNDIGLNTKKTENSSVDLNKKLNIDTNSLNKQNIINDKSKLPHEQRSGFGVPLKKDGINKNEKNTKDIQQVKKTLSPVETSKVTVQNKEINKDADGIKKTEPIKIEPVKLTPIIDKNNNNNVTNNSLVSNGKSVSNLIKKEEVKDSNLLKNPFASVSLDTKKEISKVKDVENKDIDLPSKNPFATTNVEVKKEVPKEPAKALVTSDKEKKELDLPSKNPFVTTNVEVKKEVPKEPVKALVTSDKEKKELDLSSKNPFATTNVEVKKEFPKEPVKALVTSDKEKKELDLSSKKPFVTTNVDVKKEVSKPSVVDNNVKKQETSLLKSLFGSSLNNKKEDVNVPTNTVVDNNMKKDDDILNDLLGVDPLKKQNVELISKNNILDAQESKTSSSTVLKPEEKKLSNDFVDKVLDEKIDNIKSNTNSFGIGYVTKVKDFILEVSGLDDVSFFEKVEIKGKAIGYVTAIKSNKVIVAILKEEKNILVGDVVTQTNEEFKGAFSETAFGRVIDIFGNDKLVNKKFDQLFKLPVETPNISIMDRSSVNRPLETGIIGIDFIYPIGKGQRQLIIGDKKIGKTQICLDTIVNQRDKDMLCIYIAIGKTKKEVKEIFYELTRKGAIQNTIILAAFNDEKPPVLSLTPYFGLSIAQYYLDKKKDVLVVIDDLKRHADAYREISLISGKTPGRDAYPSDIFYEHSRLLEKGCQHKNGGSITILPVVETRGGDITDYISTNIISITDGQIVLSEKSFKKGEKPAINYGLSVSRLGGAVQTPNAKKMGAIIRRKLLSYLETREVYELANFDEMSPELQEKMKSGKKILELLTQYKFSPLTENEIMERFKFINEENM